MLLMLLMLLMLRADYASELGSFRMKAPQITATGERQQPPQSAAAE
jgi:hypothetical protein